MSQIKVVFFDWGGVIADDPGDDFLRQIIGEAGVSEQKIHEILQTEMKDFMRGKLTSEVFWQRVEAASGVVLPTGIHDRFLDWPGLKANQMILSFVDELRSQNIKTAVLSNVIEPSYQAIQQAGYYGYFDAVFASCQLGYAKPDSEIYTIALAGMGCSPGETVFIDDKQRSLDPAEALGTATVLAQNPEQIVRDVRKIIAK